MVGHRILWVDYVKAINIFLLSLAIQHCLRVTRNLYMHSTSHCFSSFQVIFLIIQNIRIFISSLKRDFTNY